MAQQTFNDTKINVEFEPTSNRQQLASGDALPTLFGKISKTMGDLKPITFSGDYNDLTEIPIFVEGDNVTITKDEETNEITISSSTNELELTAEEYDNLSEEEKMNGTTYYIIDDDGGIDINIDSALSSVSTNPVQNKIITEALENKLNANEMAVSAAKLSNTAAIGSATKPVYFNENGVPVAGTYTLGAACERGVKTLTSVGTLGWGTNNDYLPDLAMLARWNGAHSGTSSNLAYCNKGAFGAAAVKGVDTAAKSGSANLITSGAVYALDDETRTLILTEVKTINEAISAIHSSVKDNTNYIDDLSASKMALNPSNIKSNADNFYIKNGNSNKFHFYNMYFRPGTSGTEQVGNDNYKWKSVYAVNGTIQTSDRKEKMDIADFSDVHEELFMLLKPQNYKMVNGDSGRTHYGFVSQDVEEALYKVGLTDMDFAGFCKYIKTEPVYEEITNEETGEIEKVFVRDDPVYDESGEPIYTYSLRYDEFIPLNTLMLQKSIVRQRELEEKVATLEEKIAILEGKVS